MGRSVSRDLPQLSIALTTGPPRVRNHVVWVGVWLLALSLGTGCCPFGPTGVPVPVTEAEGAGSELRFLPIGSELEVGWWLQKRRVRLAIVGERAGAWLIEVTSTGSGNESGYCLLVRKDDRLILEAYYASTQSAPGDPTEPPAGSGVWGLLESEGEDLDTLPNVAAALRVTFPEVEWVVMEALVCSSFSELAPGDAPAGVRAARGFQRWFSPATQTRDRRSDLWEAGRGLWTGASQTSWEGEVGEICGLRVWRERTHDFATKAGDRLRVSTLRRLTGKPTRASTVVAGETVAGWRVNYWCERVVERLGDEERQIIEHFNTSQGRPPLTVFVTDHPVISGLSPAVVTAPHLGVVWDNLRFREPVDVELGEQLVPLAVTGFGVDAKANLTWPAVLTPYLLNP